MKNIFTVDLEEYYCCNLGDNNLDIDNKINTVEKNVNKLLELFKKYNVKATFFVVGDLAEKYPEMMKRIIKEGHEISSHSWSHKLVYEMTPEEFEEDLLKSKESIEKAINKKIYGYRAPSWSITEKSLWALPILEKCGFKYSSSIFPISTFLYGIKDAPKTPNHPIVDNKELKIWEIPPATNNFVIKELGYSGGFYFRFFPFFIIKHIIKKQNKKGQSVVCYIHPWEIDKSTPKLNLKGIDKIIHYYGIRGCYKKLEKLFKTFEFDNIKNSMKF